MKSFALSMLIIAASAINVNFIDGSDKMAPAELPWGDINPKLPHNVNVSDYQADSPKGYEVKAQLPNSENILLTNQEKLEIVMQKSHH